MIQFERDSLTNKQIYYTVFISIELLAIILLFYFNIHWFLKLVFIPILLVDIYSNKRCLNRQKNFIKKVELGNNKIICTHLKNNKTIIPFEKLKFSIREKKFEKDQTEIEIKLKKSFRSKLIGRLHIKNWATIFELKNELLKNSITQVKYKPEGFWSKYGVLTADIIITGTAMTGALISDINGDHASSSDFKEIFMSISDIKETFSQEDEKEK